MIQKSTVLTKPSSEVKTNNSGRRRGSLPSPPLQPLTIKDSIKRVRNDSTSFVEEKNNEPKEEELDQDEFLDEEEDEILVLFAKDGNCDGNEESDDEEHSWSPSPLPEDGNMDDNNDIDIKKKSISIPHPPVLEEVNGKIKVTEKFMKDLIR